MSNCKNLNCTCDCDNKQSHYVYLSPSVPILLLAHDNQAVAQVLTQETALAVVRLMKEPLRAVLKKAE